MLSYLTEAGLMPNPEQLKFNLVGYGCTTCIGNSGPLPDNVAQAVNSGNTECRGRVEWQPQL